MTWYTDEGARWCGDDVVEIADYKKLLAWMKKRLKGEFVWYQDNTVRKFVVIHRDPYGWVCDAYHGRVQQIVNALNGDPEDHKQEITILYCG